ncbi:hypothetical protein ACVXHB_23080 [Escherichia coli]
MNAIFKTFAKLADVAKLHKSGAKSEPTTCAEEQVTHYRIPQRTLLIKKKSGMHIPLIAGRDDFPV